MLRNRTPTLLSLQGATPQIIPTYNIQAGNLTTMEEPKETQPDRIDREIVTGNSVELGNGTIRLTSSNTGIHDLANIALELHARTIKINDKPPRYCP